MDLAMFNETEWKYTQSIRNQEIAIVEKGGCTPI